MGFSRSAAARSPRLRPALPRFTVMPLAGATQTHLHSDGTPAARAACRRSRARRARDLAFLDLNGGLGRVGWCRAPPSTVRPRSLCFRAVGRSMPRGRTGAERSRRIEACCAIDLGGLLDIRSHPPRRPRLRHPARPRRRRRYDRARRARSQRHVAELTNRGAALGHRHGEHGGFIVDGGRGTQDGAPPILIRTELPESWRILLIIDHVVMVKRRG